MKKILLLMLVPVLLASCGNKGERRFYDGMKDRGPVAECEVSFLIKSNLGGRVSLTDTCIQYATYNKITRYRYDGTVIDSLVIDGVNNIYSYDSDSLGYYFYDLSEERRIVGYSLRGDTLFTKHITTLSPIGYFGGGKFAVPDVDSTLTEYNVYSVDTNNGISKPVFNLMQAFTPDTNDAIACSFSLACRFGNNVDGKLLLYSHFNSNFVVMEGDSVFRIGKDYRNISAARTIYIGHNRRLDPMNCGVRTGVADSTGVYLITPRYYAERWCDSGTERNIDIYDAESFRYLGSRELPESKGRYISSISKNGNRIVVLYEGGYEGPEIKVFNVENL